MIFLCIQIADNGPPNVSESWGNLPNTRTLANGEGARKATKGEAPSENVQLANSITVLLHYCKL